MDSSPLQNRIRLSQLRLLVSIAETGSIVAAAERHNVSQPAATKSLRQLESAAGNALVQRGPTGSVLTPTGELVCRRARLVLAELRHIEDELGLFHAGMVGQVVVGALPVAVAALLPRALQALARDYPRITVRIVEGTSDALFPRLKEGHLDVLVGRFWPGEEPELVNEVLFDSGFALIARAGHPLASKPRLKLSDTMALPWIVPPPGSHSRGALDAMFPQANLKPPLHGVETSSYLIIRALLVATDMVCPLPVETPEEDVARGLLTTLPLDLDVRLPPVGIVRSAQRGTSPATETFLGCLRAAARETSPAPRTAAVSTRRRSAGR
jgi:DNA-binding transcriptional LysR family regulator